MTLRKQPPAGRPTSLASRLAEYLPDTLNEKILSYLDALELVSANDARGTRRFRENNDLLWREAFSRRWLPEQGGETARPPSDCSPRVLYRDLQALVRDLDLPADTTLPVILAARSPYLGGTALEWAAKHGRLDTAKLLVAHGADVNSRNTAGETPLMWAAFSGPLALVDFLVRAGARIDEVSHNGQTALIWATRAGQLAIVKLLCSRGVGSLVNTGDTSGVTALFWAARHGHVDMLRYLLGAGASVEARDTRIGETPLIWAARRQHLQAAELLLHHGAPVDTEDRYGRTALLAAAAERGAAPMLRFLLGAGAEVSKRDWRGETALMAAAAAGDKDSVNVLLAARARINDKCNAGRTALDVAISRYHTDVVMLLSDRGAHIGEDLP